MSVSAEKFMSSLRILFPIVAIRLVFSKDFAVFQSMAPYLFRLPGVFSSITMPYPSLAVVSIIQMSVLVSSLLLLMNRLTRLSAWCLFSNLFFLDLLSNSFGFINVEIHFTWFLFFYALSFRVISKETAFRAMELIWVLAYLQAGFAKLHSSGLAWAYEGTTLQIAWMRQEMAAGLYLSKWKSLAIAFSWLSLVLEGSFLLYYPFPKIRLPLLISALLFHLGTWLTLGIDFSHLWIFAAGIIFQRIDIEQKKENMPCPNLSTYAHFAPKTLIIS